jgi:type II secretory pathway component GspD/PulD (secretin)
MKSKFSIFAFVALAALAAGLLVSLAQTNAPADASAAATSTASTNAPAPAPAPGTPAAAATDSTAVAGTNTAVSPAPALVAEAPAAATVAVAATAPADAAATPPGGAITAPSSPSLPGGAIPLIVMDDVPLTDAIRNLARQAALNYMLDPRIGFGQPGPDGKPAPQPMVSLRWENVTAEQALNALLNNYSLQLLDDAKTKIARIAVKDPAAPDPLVTKTFQLKFSNPSNIVTAVKATLQDKRSQVMADIRTSQLVVTATEREMASVDGLIEHLDTMTKQVLIEARLVELSVNPTTTKGLDWSGTFQAQNLAVGNNLQTAPVPTASVNDTLASAAGIPTLLFDTAKGFNPGTAFLDADGVKLVFSFLNTYSDAKVLSAPRVVTVDNEPAHIAVTRASPIINVTAGTANTTGGSQITYTNLGVILDVTPRISANNYVNLKVVPEVSRIFDTVSKTIGGELYQADEYDVRRIETKVLIPSGNTLVMGGMIQDDIRDAGNKVPLLGDIPVLGYLFQSHSKTRAKENVYVFITPTIVQDNDFQPTPSKFLRTPVPKKDVMESDWSAWDDGRPAALKKSKPEDPYTDPYIDKADPEKPGSAKKAPKADEAPAGTARFSNLDDAIYSSK